MTVSNVPSSNPVRSLKGWLPIKWMTISQVMHYLFHSILLTGKYHSTETALLKVNNDLTEALDNGYAAVLLLLALLTAFVMLDHQKAIEWLRHMYGFGEMSLLG